MSESHTTTGVTHYEVQKKRRLSTLEEWRGYRKTVIPTDPSKLVDTPRRMKRAVQVSKDGDAPSQVLDANLHEIPPHTVSTVHRHSWDAIVFITGGSGWTEIDGKRIQWQPWDTLHIPAWSWHRHGNDVDRPATFTTWSVQPMFEIFNAAILEEGGDAPFEDLPPAPVPAVAVEGDDPYSRRVRRLLGQSRPEDARLITRFEDAPFKVTPRGARSAFLVDQSIGYHTTGLTAVWHQLAPGLFQSRHRHGGDAWLYCVSGHGHSEIDGETYEWGPGDLIVVDYFAWHQHFNDSKDEIASLIRVHNFDTLYMSMRVMLDPLDLFEELPKLDAPDLTNVVWPPVDEGRPLA
jgi:gentisate 1,2-dioxygenase